MHPYRIGAGTLEARIAQLRGLGREGLCARWRSRNGRTAFAYLPKHLLLRHLAYCPHVDPRGERDTPASETPTSSQATADRCGTRHKPLPCPAPDRIGAQHGRCDDDI